MSEQNILKDLLTRFDNNLDAYKSGKYNEAQLRLEFVNPMFEALGWDVYNKKGYAEAYKDVVHEDAIKVGGATKAPDYSFRIGGARKFFLETKKPTVNIKEDPVPAFQLRRYAWSAKLPLSILTDFEELAVYDCRIKPAPGDKPATGRIMYVNYREYPEKWDEIANVFSREAILKGSFDRFVESEKKKRGTATVDDAFLSEIELWRDTLARNIALRNPGLTERDINFAVQLTIDRIIFLRICEDRGIEDYGRLQALINGEHVYKRMFELFYRADEKYNSGLFHFQPEKGRPSAPDELTPDLQIDDKVLKDIFKGLYYPESPYEFSVLPVDILGHVYERFLGKVIRLTSGGRAKVEEKPEVRKAGGVYYTPKYIVDYIVENTVGKLLENKNPKQVEELRILDPACGSGSFLIGAYEYLLNWHRDWYVANDPEKHKKTIYQGTAGLWYLTTAEKKKILLNNIYGVDIDPQAVEVTKLNLLLKALEGENEQTLESQLRMFRERALPDLRSNIKCGNSLIGPDFYDGKQLDLLDDQERYRINAFNWEMEFGEIMKVGGFDAVIGNPPYVRQEELKLYKNYFEKNYRAYSSISDIYIYFIEKGLVILKNGGYFSYIVSNKWLKSNYGYHLRKNIKNKCIIEIVDFGDLGVFQGASTYPSIIVIKNEDGCEHFWATIVDSLIFSSIDQYVERNKFLVNKNSLNDSGWILINNEEQNIIDKLINNYEYISLENYVNKKIYYGIKTGLNEAFVISEEDKDAFIKKNKMNRELIKPFLFGKNIKRYAPLKAKKYLIMIPRGWTKLNNNTSKSHWEWFVDNYPEITTHLLKYSEQAKKRYDQGDYWWELRPCDYYNEFDKLKVMLPDISLRGNFTLDSNGNYYCGNTAYIIGSDDKYLLGLLNSKLITFYYRNTSATYRGGYVRFIYQYLSKIPIRTINFSNPNDKSQHDRLVSLVEKMLELHKQLTAVKSAPEKTTVQRQIDATDRQIDELVYELYELTDEEIKIVEGAGL
jgi:type I restriction-modification system DNA methylase subunit/predicted type IV restriction endonuclease